VLRLSGADAIGFLQGQCTQDLWALDAAGVTRGAFLTPQGRILALAVIRREDDDLLVSLPTDLVEGLRLHLQRFVLRSKVRLTVTSATPLDEAAVRHGFVADAPKDDGLAAIRSGIATVTAATSGEWIPQMLNLDLVNAISFTKGCYTGQEIVARTQHLGRIKRRMFRYGLEGMAPAPLDPLLVEDHKVGEVVSSTDVDGGAECLAVVNLEYRGRSLTLSDGRICEPLSLPYEIPA
jgi:folate-binding protein YgfZ